MNQYPGTPPLAANTAGQMSPSGGAFRRLAELLHARTSGLAKTSMQAFALMVAGAVIGYVAQIGIARIVGAANFGTYAYVLAWVTLLGYISTLGFHVSLLRLVPAYLVQKDWPRIRGVLRFASWGSVAAAIVVAVPAALVILWLYQHDQALTATFLIGIATAPLVARQLVGAAAVRAFGGIIIALVPEKIARDSFALTFLAVAVFSGLFAPTATTAIGAMLASAIATLLLVEYFLRRVRPPEVATVARAYSARDWIKPALPLTAIMFASVLMTRSGVLVLGLQGDTLGAGIFFVAFSIAQITALPRMAVASVFAPTVSALYAQGDTAGLQALSAKAACLSLLGTSVVVVPVILYPAPLLSWFGPEFLAGAPVVAILLVGQLFAAAAGPQQHLLTMTGHERAGALFMGSSSALGFLGGLLLVGPFGIAGVAVAVAGSVIVWNIAMAVFLYWRLGLRPGLAAALLRPSGQDQKSDGETDSTAAPNGRGSV